MNLTRTLLLIQLLSFSTRADEQVPRTVSDAVTKKFPDVVSRSFAKEPKRGKQQFEAELVLKDGRKLTVEISAEGDVLSEEERVTFEQLPDAVKRAHQASRYGKSTFDSAEREIRAGKVTYELVVRVGDGKKELLYDENDVSQSP